MKKLDEPVRRLCQAINALPGIRTVDSCCGHGKRPFLIFCVFEATDVRGLALLTRAMDRRYWRYGSLWSLTLTISDVYDPANAASAITVTLESHTYGPPAYTQADDLVRNIEAHLNHAAYLEAFGLEDLAGIKITDGP